MAEMTAEQALAILNGSEKSPKDLAELATSIGKGIQRGENSMMIIWASERDQLAELIERQAAEIERLNQTWPNSCDFKDDDGCCLFPGAMTPECHADACSVIKGLKQEIERLNKSLQFEQNYLSRVGTHAEGCYKWGPGHWDCAMQEIAQRDRMIEKACKRLSMTNMSIRTEKQWLAWLENEAEVQTDETAKDSS